MRIGGVGQEDRLRWRVEIPEDLLYAGLHAPGLTVPRVSRFAGAARRSFQDNVGRRAASTSVDPTDGEGLRGRMEIFRGIVNRAFERGDEAIELPSAFGLGKLDHQRFVDQRREIDRRGVDPFVQEAFREV